MVVITTVIIANINLKTDTGDKNKQDAKNTNTLTGLYWLNFLWHRTNPAKSRYSAYEQLKWKILQCLKVTIHRKSPMFNQ